MHIITILREYLEETQQSLANRAGITPADLSEIETRPPYGSIEKFKRLSDALGVPVHTLVSNDCTGVPASFFDAHPPKPYIDRTTGIGRDGEEYDTGRKKSDFPGSSRPWTSWCCLFSKCANPPRATTFFPSMTMAVPCSLK